MEDQLSLPELILEVTAESLPLFTTLLQSGIEINCNDGLSMGHFLNELPGFTPEYISDIIQTIFLNGTAEDDMTTPLTGKNPVLALSAAMPGLAGAIFRKNSLHSALRTETRKQNTTESKSESLTVTLKLFNSIAKERGAELLKKGVNIPSISIDNFLNRRATLRQHIQAVQFEGVTIDKSDLLPILSENSKINIQIVSAHG